MSSGPAQGAVERPDGRYTVLRPPLTQRLLATAAVAGMGVLSLVPDSSRERMPLAISLPWCALMAVVACAEARVRVELGPTVRITNFFRTLTISWNDIEEFDYRGGAGVALVDGRRHRISAFSASSRSLPFVERQCREAVRLLENPRRSRLHNRRGRGGPPDSRSGRRPHDAT